MASHRKKESEGIALLSIYGDEDDEMEDVEEDEATPNQQQQDLPIKDVVERSGILNVEENSRIMIPESPGNKITSSFIHLESMQQQQDSNENFTPGRGVNLAGSASVTTTPQYSLTSPQQLLLEQRTQKARLAIVDYGHDEVAMSPEAEEGEIRASYVYGEELPMISGDFRERTVNIPSNQAIPPQQFGPSQVDAVNHTVNESECAEPVEAVMVSLEDTKDIDPLDKFLPPPPKEKCSEELQERIIKFLGLKKAGRIYNAEVRNRKEYRNPDFLLHAVTYQDIDQIGSCFSKDVFDPHGYDKSDFYDEIEADMRREMQRKEEERKRSQKVDFISGGAQPGTVVPTPKISLPVPGMTTVGGTGLTTISTITDAVARDGRQNKKSKWDKVDDDRKNLLPPGQDPVSAIAAHAALLSAANAGSGYSAFAQQRRREAEDKRSSDKKIERRS